jgi:hypothetical protein
MDRDHFPQIGIINRAQLLDDSLNLARAGLLDYATALNVTRYLANELEYLPWKAALNALGYIESMLVKTGNYDKFKVCIIYTLFHRSFSAKCRTCQNTHLTCEVVYSETNFNNYSKLPKQALSPKSLHSNVFIF